MGSPEIAPKRAFFSLIGAFWAEPLSPRLDFPERRPQPRLWRLRCIALRTPPPSEDDHSIVLHLFMFCFACLVSGVEKVARSSLKGFFFNRGLLLAKMRILQATFLLWGIGLLRDKSGHNLNQRAKKRSTFQFFSKNEKKKKKKQHTHTHLVWGFFTFQCFVFFLIFAFSCLKSSSSPLFLDLLKPKSGPSNEVIGTNLPKNGQFGLSNVAFRNPI